MNEAIFTAAELAEVIAYHRPKYLYAMITEVTDLLVIVLMLGVLVRPLYAGSERAAAWLEKGWLRLRSLQRARAAPETDGHPTAEPDGPAPSAGKRRRGLLDVLWNGPGWGTALLFAVATYATLVLLSIPTAIYFEWHERKFNLSSYTNTAYAWDWVKGFGSTTLIRAALAFGLYGLARRVRHWWIPLGVTCAGLMLVASALDPYRALMFFEQAPLPEGPLRTRIEANLDSANVEYADILVEKTSRASRKANAYFAGQGPTRSIVLNDVLVERFTPEEVVAAVAHETGHLSESKEWNRIASALALVGFLAFLAWLFELAARRHWWGITERADIRTLPLATIAIYFIQSAAFPVTSYFSRERERQADAHAIAVTQDPAAFRSMLVKLCRVNKCDPEPPRWLVLRGVSHPPMGERIRFAERELQKNRMSTGGPP